MQRGCRGDAEGMRREGQQRVTVVTAKEEKKKGERPRWFQRCEDYACYPSWLAEDNLLPGGGSRGRGSFCWARAAKRGV